jgi:hypothetical protein
MNQVVVIAQAILEAVSAWNQAIFMVPAPVLALVSAQALAQDLVRALVTALPLVLNHIFVHIMTRTHSNTA